MWWQPDDGPWSEAATQRYLDGGYHGVYLQLGRGTKSPHLEFLREVPGLRYLEVNGKVIDDTAAFRIPELEELILLTGSKRAIPTLEDLAELGRLGIDDRPGKESIRHASKLQHLTIWRWKGPDLRFLASSSQLRSLRIEGTMNLVSLAGVEGCPDLREIEMTQLRVDTLQPLAQLSSLKTLRLIGSPRIDETPHLDLVDIVGLRNLEQLTLTYAGEVRSLRPIARMPALTEVRLRGTHLVDNDLEPLSALPPTVTVVGPYD
jgi:hypothetical protein